MPNGEFESVYHKIQQIKNSTTRKQPIPIDAISNELAINRELVMQYVTAMHILDMIQDYDRDAELVIA